MAVSPPGLCPFSQAPPTPSTLITSKMRTSLLSSFLSLVLTFCSHTVLSTPAPAPTPESFQLRTRDIYQFPNVGTWVENLAVRANGQLIISRLDEPTIQLVDPFAPGKEPVTIYTFPAALGALGIVEYAPDVFAVLVGNFSLTNLHPSPGTFVVWKVDMRTYHGPGTATVTKITDLPTALVPNGAATLDSIQGAILFADSQAGTVVRVDTSDGTNTVVQKDATMGYDPSSGKPVGINGLRVRNGYLYFTNLNLNIFVRVPINSDGTARGEYETLVTNTVGAYDDFAVDVFGQFFVCQGVSNTLAEITVRGKVGTEQQVAGNTTSHAIAGNTSARFGRTFSDLRTLYVTTTGGQLEQSSFVVEGAKIVAVDVPFF